MTRQPLAGLQVVECASFVAGPTGGLTLAQLGAEVIRVDPIGGGSDHQRWPVAPTGESYYWTSLNKGKRSVAVDLRSGAGKELVTALITAPGPDRGVLVDNVVGRRWMSYDALTARRPDLIHVRVQGYPDGRPAVDYTVNAEVGLPGITGREEGGAPVNHVLSDVALSGVANLGWLSEAAARGTERPRHGNHVYGSFGVDFTCSDGNRVMVVALTEGQWAALCSVTKTGEVFAALETALDADLTQEADRYRLRETIAAVLRPWFAARDYQGEILGLTDAEIGRLIDSGVIAPPPTGPGTAAGTAAGPSDTTGRDGTGRMTIGSVAEGPYFDELTVGQTFRSAPGVTLTAGLADVHRSIVGGRLALALDNALCAEVTGAAALAPPNVVWDVAIGQSTVVTQHVKANLFYRGLVFRRTPEIGDTLRTSTEVVALRQNSVRAGRRPTGLAVLRITTVDQRDRPVLDFWRCAMLPLRDPDRATGHRDDIEAVGAAGAVGAGAGADPAQLAAVVEGWDLARFAAATQGARFADLSVGQSWQVGGGDVVSSAPELARLTLNIAQVHHDVRADGGRRLVYGGHTIGLAFAQVTRALPRLVTVAGWHGCDHVGPVYEGDTLRSGLTVEELTPLAAGGGLVSLRSRVRADGEPDRDVLDWRFVAVLP